MNGVNQILVIAVGALILIGLLGATNGKDGFMGKMAEQVTKAMNTDVSAKAPVGPPANN